MFIIITSEPRATAKILPLYVELNSRSFEQFICSGIN